MLTLKNIVYPEIFHCIEYIFYHSGFLSNFMWGLKIELHRLFHCIEYFYI